MISVHERDNEALLVVPRGETGAERALMHVGSQLHLILVLFQSMSAISQALTNVVSKKKKR